MDVLYIKYVWYIFTFYYLDGIARAGSSLFNELKSAVFSNVAQRAIRYVACNTFYHLLNLDLKFHLERQSGALSRALERGSRFFYKNNQ